MLLIEALATALRYAYLLSPCLLAKVDLQFSLVTDHFEVTNSEEREGFECVYQYPCAYGIA